MSDDLKDRLDVWFRAHLQGIRSTVIVFGVVIGCALLSYFVTKCLSPYPSLPSAPPTIAPINLLIAVAFGVASPSVQWIQTRALNRRIKDMETAARVQDYHGVKVGK